MANLTLSYAPESFSNGGFNAIAAYLFLLAFFSVTLNLIVLILYITNKSLHNPMNLMFVSLTVSDLMVSVFGTSFQFVAAVLRRNYMGAAGCGFYGFTTFWGGCASITSLTVIAFERYLTVARPFNVGNLTYRGALISVAFTWLFSLIWAGGPLIGWSQYVPEGSAVWCSIDWITKTPSNVSYVICIFIFCYFLPIILILFSYGSVYFKVREVAKSTGGTSTAGKAEGAILKMSVIMVACYILAWTPYAAVVLKVAFGDSSNVTTVEMAAPSLFAKSCTVYNPLIYVGLNKQFRAAFFNLFFKGKNPFDRGQAEDKPVAKDVSYNATMGESSKAPSPGPSKVPGNKVAPAP